jgi:hypothetical protein
VEVVVTADFDFDHSINPCARQAVVNLSDATRVSLLWAGRSPACGQLSASVVLPKSSRGLPGRH